MSQPLLSTAKLTNPKSAQPTLISERTGTYVLPLIVNDGHVDSAPDTVTVTVKPTATTVVQDLQALQVTISKLDQSNFKDKKAQKTLNDNLNAVIKAVNAGTYTTAINKLQKGVLTKTDGRANAGTRDKKTTHRKMPGTNDCLFVK